MLKFHMIWCIVLTIVGVSLALNQKLPKSIAKHLKAGRRGDIALVMPNLVAVKARYTINPKDGHLAVTSRWAVFGRLGKLMIGSVVKLDISPCCHCNDLVFKFAFV